MVSWASHKQPQTADSSCYAEYISLHDASHEAIFLRQLLDELNMPLSEPTPLYGDNDAARQLIEDQRWHSKVRHFRVKYHSTRELVDFDELKVLRVRSSDNTASGAAVASGQGREPSSQGSNPCWRVTRVSVRLHSTQLYFPRSGMRSGV